MRKILFRGKSTGGIDKWIEGTGVFSDGINTWISFNEPNCAIARGLKHKSVQPETVGQFTGLYDKNGTKIFEGDILREPYHPERDTVVEWNDGRFRFRHIGKDHYDYLCFSQDITNYRKIIGTIHDNPELLKGETV